LKKHYIHFENHKNVMLHLIMIIDDLIGFRNSNIHIHADIIEYDIYHYAFIAFIFDRE